MLLLFATCMVMRPPAVSLLHMQTKEISELGINLYERYRYMCSSTPDQCDGFGFGFGIGLRPSWSVRTCSGQDYSWPTARRSPAERNPRHRQAKMRAIGIGKFPSFFGRLIPLVAVASVLVFVGAQPLLSVTPNWQTSGSLDHFDILLNVTGAIY
jgi:hypothetical protein